MKKPVINFTSIFIAIVAFFGMKMLFDKRDSKDFYPTKREQLYEKQKKYNQLNGEMEEFTDLMNSRDSFFNTKSDVPGYKGINMNIYFPSTWKETRSANTEPSTVKEYGRQMGDTLSVGMTVEIITMDRNFTEYEIAYGRSKDHLEKTIKGKAFTFSCKKLLINNVKADEVFMTQKVDDGMSFNAVYHLFYKNTFVVVTYLIINKYAENSNAAIVNYIPVFKRLINKTQILKP